MVKIKKHSSDFNPYHFRWTRRDHIMGSFDHLDRGSETDKVYKKQIEIRVWCKNDCSLGIYYGVGLLKV